VPQLAPFGTWPSPITPEVLVERAIGLSGVEVAGGIVLWSEARPDEAGRQTLVAWSPGGVPEDLLPPTMSARTLVHEYGGRGAALGPDGLIVFSSAPDQRLWRLDGPRPLTPEPHLPGQARYGDPVVSPDGRFLVCVRERHGELPGDTVVNDLVVVDLPQPAPPSNSEDAEPTDPPEPRVLASGHDFYAAPRLSPDGRRLVFLTWDHPDMAWDATDLWSAPFHRGRLGQVRRVAGGPGVSISQPRFAPDGTLHYLSDQSGWWNLYREGPQPVALLSADLGGPDWTLGQATYAFLDDSTLVATWIQPDGQHLGLLRTGRVPADGVPADGVPADGVPAEPGDVFSEVATPFTSFASLQGLGTQVVGIAASPVHPPAVVLIDPATGHHQVIRESRPLALPPEAISTPDPFQFPAADGGPAYGLYYPPRSATHEGPPGELPPLVVVSHGGPTSAARRELSMDVQFWTTRGFALADVDYRGSTGYGRPYRDRLRGQWGIADMQDCADAAAHLAHLGLADPSRMVIRGSSAGGMTVLNCLAHTDRFAAGASRYGVADLSSLATTTHKFEAHYLDHLVGPWPEAAPVYAHRSPLTHAPRIRRPLILFQGTDDQIVPPAQSEAMVAALRAAGTPVTYLLFSAEGHGFRRADTLVAVADAELSFFARVLGLSLPGLLPGAPTGPPSGAAAGRPEGPESRRGLKE